MMTRVVKRVKVVRVVKRKRKRKNQKKKRAKVRYLTKAHLIECSRLGRKWRYNRQLSSKVRELPEGRYPVLYSLVHCHRQMNPCEPHMRLGIGGPEGLMAFVDVPMAYYEALPHHFLRVPDHWQERLVA